MSGWPRKNTSVSAGLCPCPSLVGCSYLRMSSHLYGSASLGSNPLIVAAAVVCVKIPLSCVTRKKGGRKNVGTLSSAVMFWDVTECVYRAAVSTTETKCGSRCQKGGEGTRKVWKREKEKEVFFNSSNLQSERMSGWTRNRKRS